MHRITRKRKAAAWLILVPSLAFLGGCVERRYTIRTDPPGALVFVNGQEIGPSPASVHYTYYAAHEIVLVADGYQTQRIIQELPAPWYDNLLTEFFTENLLPVTVHDDREFVYKMQVATNPAQGELLQRAEGLRQEGKLPPPERRGGILGFFGF
jgi:hypothetical protein